MSRTFDERDWAALTDQDKKLLRKFSRVAMDFEPLAQAVGVGQKSMDSLIEKGLAVESKRGVHGRSYKLTEKGWLAVEWCNGDRMQEVRD